MNIADKILQLRKVNNMWRKLHTMVPFIDILGKQNITLYGSATLKDFEFRF